MNISHIYNWMKEHKDFQIYDDEHFLAIIHKSKHGDIVKEVYSSTSKVLTEDFLKNRINKLEKECHSI